MNTKTVRYRAYDSALGFYYETRVEAYVISSPSDINSSLASGWYVVEGTVGTSGLEILGNVNLILADGASFTVQRVLGSAVAVAANSSLTIYGQDKGTGKLTASTGNLGAGIAVGRDNSFLTINGGCINATGNAYGAGIGGSYQTDSGQNITINGGNVTAQGGVVGAGIGGCLGAGIDININGGIINATGGSNAGAGIGGGLNSGLRSSNITGGVINAKARAGGAEDIGKGGRYGINSKNYIWDSSKTGETITLNTTLSVETYTRPTYTYYHGNVAYTDGHPNYRSYGGYYRVTRGVMLTNVREGISFGRVQFINNRVSGVDRDEFGDYSARGGAIYNDGGTVYFSDAEFSNNYAIGNWTVNRDGGCGGAIYSRNGAVILDNATFKLNIATSSNGECYGGAIDSRGNDALTICNSYFEGNRATSFGGAISAGETLTIDNTTFVDNHAYYGGAIVLYGTTANISNCTFSQNTSFSDVLGGGAIYEKGSRCTLRLCNVTFNGNRAGSGLGGAILFNGGTIELAGKVNLLTATDTISLGNSGTLNWNLTGEFSYGYINNYSRISSCDHSRTITVDADDIAGAVTYTLAGNAGLAEGQTFTLTGVEGEEDVRITVNGEAVMYNKKRYRLSTNSSKDLILTPEGDMNRVVVSVTTYPPDGKLTQNGAVFKDIVVAMNGGAFYVDNTGTLTLNNSTFSSNRSNNGGAIYTVKGGTVHLSNVTFSNNLSTEDGKSGAIYNEGTTNLNGNVTLTAATDTIYNAGDLVWCISKESYGYISDFSRIDRASGNLVITGVKGIAYGDYKLADNAVDIDGLTFIARGTNGDKTITVNGAVLSYSETYAGKLYTNDANELHLQLFASRQVVNKANFPEDGVLTLKAGFSVDMSENPAYAGNGSMYYVESDGTLTSAGRTEFIGCSATGMGGLIYNTGGKVALRDVGFGENKSTQSSGGVIYCNQATAGFTEAIFYGNYAFYDGGAITSYGGTLTLDDVYFSDNSSGRHGGAIQSDHNSQITVKNAEFSKNIAQSNGGAIHIEYGTVLALDEVTFSDNIAANGGAISVGMAATTLLQGRVTLATVSDTIHLDSGAVLKWVVTSDKTGYLSNYGLITGTKNAHTLTIDASATNGNSSYVLADNAAVANGQKFTITLNDSTTRTITVNGAACVDTNNVNYHLTTNASNQLVLSLTTRTVVNAYRLVKDGDYIDLTGCEAYKGNGGAFLVTNTGTLASNKNSGIIAINSKATGNGGFTMNEGIVDMDAITMDGNEAGQNGGAVYSNGILSMNNSEFRENIAVQNGGAVYLAAGKNTLSGSFIENSADGNGGAIYVAAGASLDLKKSIFQDNIAKLGGAVYNEGTINLKGEVELSYSTDIFYNTGNVNWDLSARTDDNEVSIVNYQYLNNASGTLSITVSNDMPANASYILATGSADCSYQQTFTLKGIGDTTATITVNDDGVEYGGRGYYLDATVSGSTSELTLTSVALTRRATNSDINGNGRSDVVFQWTGTLVSPDPNCDYRLGYWMDGTNDWRSDNVPLSANWTPIKAKDMNSDGEADVVMLGKINEDYAVVGYYGSGYNSNWIELGGVNDPDSWDMAVGNVTGHEDKNSIIFHSLTLGSITVWQDGDASKATTLSGTFGDGWEVEGTGDFTGNGKEKILLSYSGNLYTVDIASNFETLSTKWGDGWEVRAIGDFSDDGRDDIVLFNSEMGLMVKLNNGDENDWEQIGQLDANDWFIAGAGDYDGDQRDDLLVRQYSTGVLGYYQGGHQTLWKELGSGVDMNWTVIA